MIKALVALLFEEPLGGKSVFSHIFSHLISKDIKCTRNKLRITGKIANNILSDKLKGFVDASKVEQEKIREKNNTDNVVSILVHTGLSEAREEDVLECYHAFVDGVRNSDTSLLFDSMDNSTNGPTLLNLKG